MRLRIIARFLALLTVLVSVSMVFPLAWALHDGTRDSHAIIASIGVGLLTSSALFAAGRGARPQDMGAREAFAAVTLAWIFSSLLGAMPYMLGGYIPSFTDAYFEAMSGFTTTGSTIMTDIEACPRGILMWRSQTQWLGGMGIVVLTIALLPMSGVTMTQLFRAESPGPVLEKISPRIQDMSKMLWQVYMGLTIFGIALLMCGGMNLFESICHIFTAVSTGGFSPKNASVGAYASAWHDWSLTLVMFLSGANFSLHLLAVRNRSLRPYKDPEFLFYTGIVIFSTALITIFIYVQGYFSTILTALRFAAFQVVTVITTTGYATTDYALWPPATQMVLLLLMVIGGCAGSTAGAAKCIRIEVAWKRVVSEIRHCIHPNAVIPIRIGDKTVEHDTAAAAATFVFLYVLIWFVSSLAVSATGQDIVTSISAVAATLGNVGPGLGAVGPTCNFASQHVFAKWVYTFCMLCGRLELYTVLVLFTRDAWKR